MTPNPYEAPTCQETKEVRAEDAVFRQEIHRQSTTLGVTDLISSAGFAGTCPVPNTYRGSDFTRCSKREAAEPIGKPCALETIPFPHAGSVKASGLRPVQDATSWGGARGRGSTRQTRRTYQWLWGRRAAGRQSKHGVAGDADHSRGCARGTSIRCDWPVGFIRVAPVGRRAAPPPPIQSW